MTSQWREHTRTCRALPDALDHLDVGDAELAARPQQSRHHRRLRVSVDHGACA